MQKVRRRIEETEKQGRVVKVLAGLKDSDKFKALSDALDKARDNAGVFSDLVAMVESYNSEMKDMSSGDAEVRGTVITVSA